MLRLEPSGSEGTCRRYLSPDGYLTEVVRFFLGRLHSQQLENFINSFPIKRSGT
jgi:hypothetical protein